MRIIDYKKPNKVLRKAMLRGGGHVNLNPFFFPLTLCFHLVCLDIWHSRNYLSSWLSILIKSMFIVFMITCLCEWWIIFCEFCCCLQVYSRWWLAIKNLSWQTWVWNYWIPNFTVFWHEFALASSYHQGFYFPCRVPRW